MTEHLAFEIEPHPIPETSTMFDEKVSSYN